MSVKVPLTAIGPNDWFVAVNEKFPLTRLSSILVISILPLVPAYVLAAPDWDRLGV